MSKGIEAFRKSIGELLGRYERRPVVLPEFQRPYSWDKAQVTAFWSDLLEFQRIYAGSPVTASYFLGSVVILKSDEQIVLLDGQQRLATATIALSAMRDVARSLDLNGTKVGADLARDIQRELLQKDTKPVTYSLTLGELDEEFFLKAIKVDPPLAASPKLRSHELIEAAREISREKVREFVGHSSLEQAKDVLENLQDALTKGMLVVAIQVQTEDDAFSIFESLNDRGLRLSVPDLVLNLLMRRASTKKEQRIVRDKWNAVVRHLGRRDVSRFLRHMWVSGHGDVKSQGLFTVIKAELEAKKISSSEFADECLDECETYIALLDQTLRLPKNDARNLEGLVRYLDVQPALPLLLSAYRCLNGSDFGKLLRMAVVQYVRYVLVTNQNPLHVETAFYEAARVMRDRKRQGDTSAKVLAGARGILRRLDVDDAAVEIAARDLELERTEAIWLMTQLANERQSKTREIATAVVNLEHIFPQNPATGWKNVDDLAPFRWHIGNLTILGEKLNRQAQNKSFAEKKAQFYAKSEVKMTQDLSRIAAWTPEALRKRAALLAKQVVATWR